MSSNTDLEDLYVTQDPLAVPLLEVNAVAPPFYERRPSEVSVLLLLLALVKSMDLEQFMKYGTSLVSRRYFYFRFLSILYINAYSSNI